MDFVKSQFETALNSKRPITKQNVALLLDPIEQSQLPVLYRWLFYRLNNHLLHLARHNQATDVFLLARQLSIHVHDHFINSYSSSSSSAIKQLGQILKNLQQQQPYTQSELNQWKRSQEDLRRDDLFLICIFHNAPQMALLNDSSLLLSDLIQVGLQTCVQNLADRDTKTSLKILLSLGLAPLDIIHRIMSTTVYHDLRTYCAQYLTDFGEEFYLNNQEINTLRFINQLKQLYTSETVLEIMETRKQSNEYWNRIFTTTPSIKSFICRDIVPNRKQSSSATTPPIKLAYMQSTFDWIHGIMDQDENRWLLTTEGRHLFGEQPLFSSKGIA